MLDWAAGDKQPLGGSLGEWIFNRTTIQANTIETIPEELDTIPSLTLGAAQRNWRTPTEFPCTPQASGDSSLVAYAENIKAGEVFCRNEYSTSLVISSGFSEDKQSLYVMTESPKEEEAIKPYALTKVSYENGVFVHYGRTFFS